MRTTVDCREMVGGDGREASHKSIIGNAFRGQSGGHGSRVLLLSHIWGGVTTVTSLCPHVSTDSWATGLARVAL